MKFELVLWPLGAQRHATQSVSPTSGQFKQTDGALRGEGRKGNEVIGRFPFTLILWGGQNDMASFLAHSLQSLLMHGITTNEYRKTRRKKQDSEPQKEEEKMRLK
jgi:hypothetical protein